MYRVLASVSNILGIVWLPLAKIMMIFQRIIIFFMTLWCFVVATVAAYSEDFGNFSAKTVVATKCISIYVAVC